MLSHGCLLVQHVQIQGYVIVLQWLALLPHRKKVLGSDLSMGRAFLCGVCMVSSCLLGFPPGTVPLTKTLAEIWSWSSGTVADHWTG